jgi:predicted RecB family nuclease
MRRHDNSMLYSPSDLVRYLGCAHATALDLARLRASDAAPEQAEDDAMGKLVQQAGLEHEDAYRAQLADQGGLVEIPEKGSLETRASLTQEAMEQGAKAIFQAAFLQPPWSGFADFLIRVEEPSDLGGWSYEPVDTKLARSAKVGHVVQLGLYARMIAAIQGKVPRRMHVQLGDGRRESFRLVDFDKVLGAAITRYLAFVESGAEGSEPEPCSACSLCPWRDHCAEVWEAKDHLSRVCGIGKPQIEKLRAGGITTVAQLAALPDAERIPRLAPTTLDKLRAQAILQQTRWQGGEPVVEPLAIEEGRGFANLPQPDPADLFFDLEGDPLEEGGLDYLWGVHYRDGSGPKFRFRWGHNHADERTAFENTMDWMAAHLEANPGAHVYH